MTTALRAALNPSMLLAEVEYARPSSVDEALRLLSAHDGARALAGGQTLTNVMKARAAAPDVLVDLADLAELRRSLGRLTAASSSARWPSPSDRSAEVPTRGRSSPRCPRRSPTSRSATGGRSAGTSARTIRRTTYRRCGRPRRDDDDPRRGRRADGRGGGVLPRRVHDRRRAGRAADEDHDSRGGRRRRRLRVDHDRQRRNVHRQRRRHGADGRRESRSAVSPPRRWS